MGLTALSPLPPPPSASESQISVLIFSESGKYHDHLCASVGLHVPFASTFHHFFPIPTIYLQITIGENPHMDPTGKTLSLLLFTPSSASILYERAHHASESSEKDHMGTQISDYTSKCTTATKFLRSSRPKAIAYTIAFVL